ncbi:MAG: DNA repair protein RecN [Pseudomonadota bacterium]
MLTEIHVRNLAIVDELDVELAPGMTALTGETGAGKSILIDALGLVLGDRADVNAIRHGAERAEIAASFDLGAGSVARAWLLAHDLDLDGECQLRRVIGRDGRSRGYINGQPVPMQSLRELGEQLVDIHGQHEHQSLLRTAVQRAILDAYGGHPALLGEVANLYREWQTTRSALESASAAEHDRDARLDLLRYQLNELEALALERAEIEAIDEEHARAANAGRLLESAQRGLERLDSEDGDAAASLLSRTLDEISELTRLDPALEESARLLGESALLLREGIDALRHYAEHLDIDPARLLWLEERIGVLHDLARKHRCQPAQLPEVEARLRTELDALEHADRLREQLVARLAQLEHDYLASARKLTTQRRQAAGTFGREISAAMQTLGMAGGVFEVDVGTRRDTQFSQHGMDAVEFRVSANPGQPLQALARVASGGELSRISLCIQTLSADSCTIPTLIFDEVDSGIGGGVAEIVGRKLRALARGHQVLCVTHLPQVAAQAQQQLQVSKTTREDSTLTRIRALDEGERIDELARMLGGVTITRQSRDHAREMIAQAGADLPAGRRPRGRRPRAQATD